MYLACLDLSHVLNMNCKTIAGFENGLLKTKGSPEKQDIVDTVF